MQGRLPTGRGGVLPSKARRVREIVLGRLYPTVIAGDPSGADLALTFDDGPTPGLTERIGQALADRGHRATFFVLVDRAEECPSAISRLVELGHEVGLHGLRHERLTSLAPAQVRAELTSGAARLRALGAGEVRLMRPPYGAQTPATYRATRRAQLTPVIWSVDPRDHAADSPADVAEALDRGLVPGAITLLHDGNGDRADGLLTADECALKEQIVSDALSLLDARQLRSVTLSTLIASGARTTGWFY